MPNLTIPDRHRVRKGIADWSGRNDWPDLTTAIKFVNRILLNHHIDIVDKFDSTDESGRVGLRVCALPQWKNRCAGCSDSSFIFDNELLILWQRGNFGYLVRFYLT